jgi:hypothetical protein
VLDVETTPSEVRIHEAGQLIATHALLQGRRQRSVLPGHRHLRRITGASVLKQGPVIAPGQLVAVRSLEVYEHIGRQMGARR